MSTDGNGRRQGPSERGLHGRGLVLTPDPDAIDYDRLLSAAQLADDSGTSVVARNLCFSCPSDTTIPPSISGRSRHISVRHETWCPVLARQEGRELTPAQVRRQRRHMDHG